jgi:O-antigen/teichoic acid export membrane protein
LQKLFSTSFVFVLSGSLLVFLVLFFGAFSLNNWLFSGQYDFVFVFKILSVATPFIAVSALFNAIINGLSKYKQFVALNILSYVVSAFLMGLLVYYKNLNGALFALAITPILQFVFLFYLYFRVLRSYVNFKNISFQIPYGQQFLPFVVMSLVATFLSSFVEIHLRRSLVLEIDELNAGNWTAMTYISNQYFAFTAGIFTLYVLPKFASLHTNRQFQKEVLGIYKTILPLFSFGLLLLFVCREWVILILQSEAFLGMKTLFKWQLLGDFVKMASLIISHQFLAKKMVKEFIITELISLLLFFGLASFFLRTHGAEGIVFAHFIRYILYFLAVVFALRKFLFGK